MTQRNNGSRALMILCAIGVPVVGALWFVYRLTERTIEAIDRNYGDAFWLALALFLTACVAFTAAGGAYALVRRWNRHIRAKDGLFPVLETRRGMVNVNEPGAQTLAALAGASGRVSAPMAARVIDAHYRDATPEIPQVMQLESQPARSFPQLAPVYDAQLPQRLALPVGVDGNGRQVALPLRNLGNVLVAGLPGSGKSELLASMLAGLLRQDATGERVQVAMVDTKLVSFGNLPPMPALYAPPALEIDHASALTAQLLDEVRDRFQRLHEAHARTLEEYEDRTGERLPYLVGVYDELADLTTDSDRGRRDAFIAAAQEIGRKGRAAGVSLVMATQRPSADVIPSSLRNLTGAAVAFRMARADDSRLVIGESGAETLTATPGRCLVRHADTTEVQGFWAGLEGGRFDAFCASLPGATVAGVPVYNWPTTPTVATVAMGGQAVVTRLQPGREPDAQLAERMRGWYAGGMSKTQICDKTWGYKDGATWAILERVLGGEL